MIRAAHTVFGSADAVFALAFLVALATLWLVDRHWPAALDALDRRARVVARVVSHRPRWALAGVALLPIVLRLLTLPVDPIPLPRVHDEFSYLLAGDTFAHGRLTNPTPPGWQSFETFHVLQRPSYMSMYPPAQGLALAVGEKFFGHPWWGVVLSFGVMCGLIFWACAGWLSAGWSLYGAVLASLRLGFGSSLHPGWGPVAERGYWLNSYWGGAVAAIGGCLVIGSLGRIWREPDAPASRRWLGVLLGLGIAILANSRPWEGLWLTLAVGVVLVYRWASRRGDTGTVAMPALRQVVMPCAIVLVVAGVWMGYDNWRVTGSAVQLPYTLDARQYRVAPLFLWSAPAPPKTYRYDVLRRFYTEWEPSFENIDRYATPRGFVVGVVSHARMALSFLFGVPFTILVVVFARRLLGDGDARVLLVCGGIWSVGFILAAYYFPHYLAPVVALAVAIQMFALRALYGWRWRGRAMGRLLAFAFLAAALAAAPSGGAHLDDFPQRRAAIERQLRRMPGRQLVLVRYAPSHNYHEEWVYDSADIDSADVVWARYSTAAQNRTLMRFYCDRSVWALEPDAPAPRNRPWLIASPGCSIRR